MNSGRSLPMVSIRGCIFAKPKKRRWRAPTHAFQAVFQSWRDFKALSLKTDRQSTLSQINRIVGKDALLMSLWRRRSDDSVTSRCTRTRAVNSLAMIGKRSCASTT